jgi:hypothetical protein
MRPEGNTDHDDHGDGKYDGPAGERPTTNPVIVREARIPVMVPDPTMPTIGHDGVAGRVPGERCADLPDEPAAVRDVAEQQHVDGGRSPAAVPCEVLPPCHAGRGRAG